METSAAGSSTFTNIFQIGLVVRDMDKAIQRFTALGVGPFKPRILSPDAKETFRGKPFFPSQRVKIEVAQVGNLELELIQPIDGASPHQEFLDEKGEGIQHLGIFVKDVKQEAKTLTEKGAEVLLTSERIGGGRVAYLDLNAAGLIIEIVQRPEITR